MSILFQNIFDLVYTRVSIRYTIAIGIIINWNIIVNEEYVIYKCIEQKGAQYSPLGHTLFNI